MAPDDDYSDEPRVARTIHGIVRRSRHLFRRTTPTRPEATARELIALQHVLRGDDPRFKLLAQQLETAPAVHREHPTPDSIRVGPTSTFEDLNFVLEVGRLASEWVPVRDVKADRTLEFRVLVARSGFLEALEGRTADGGPWPDEWDLPPVDRASSDTPPLVLPSLSETEQAQRAALAGLVDWLGIPLRNGLTVYPPVTRAAIGLREQDLGVRFSDGYRTFLSIADGIESREFRVLGHVDVYRVEDAGVVVAWDADDAADFLVVQRADGLDERVYRMDAHRAMDAPAEHAISVAAYLRRRLGV